MKSFNFLYITTNLINGKQYVGEHSTDNLSDNYLGSGKYLKYAIKKYGKKNFQREILQFFETKEESFRLQEQFINKFNTLVPNGYNISPKGGHQISGGLSPESIRSMKEKKKGKSPWNKGLKLSQFSGDGNSFFGKTHTIKTLEIIGAKSRELKRTPEWNEKISKSHIGDKNSFFGKHHSEETKEKLRRPKSEETKRKISESQKKRLQKA